MQQLLLTLLLPVLFMIGALVYTKHKFKLKSVNFLIQALVFGLLSVAVLVAMDLFARIMEWNLPLSLKRIVFYSFVVVGLGAEIGKFVVLRYIFMRMKQFRGPVDGIIYSTFIGLGFTIISLPLFSTGFIGEPVKFSFIIYYPLANIAFAIITGFFVGMGKLRRNKLIDSLTGLGTAVFLHGFYYFINRTNEYTIFALYAAGTLLIATVLLLKARKLKAEVPSVS